MLRTASWCWLLSSLLLACSSTTQGGDVMDAIDATGADIAMNVDTGVADSGTDASVLDANGADSGGGTCSSGATCSAGLDCCSGGCMNLQNDPLNCGQCGHACAGATPMCGNGTCTAQTCSPACGAGSVCCEVNRGGPLGAPMCYPGMTCPVGCPLCR